MADEELEVTEDEETHTDEEGEVIDPTEGGEYDRADEEEVPPVDDEGVRPDIDWDEEPTEGDADAQQTFTEQPVPPYRAGDVWVDGDSTYVAVVGKAEGEQFSQDDWQPSVTPYTPPEVIKRTVTFKERISDYSAETLADYEARGATAYALYDDGTRVQVPWSEVVPPTPTVPEIVEDEARALAEATNQHFWQNSDQPETHGGAGVHVTDETQDEWKQAVADGFPDLSDEKPHHNVLINSLGILLRSALRNLVSITRSAIAFFDGQGNDNSNVVAFFGKDGAQIGRSSGVNARITAHFFEANGARFRVGQQVEADGYATVAHTLTSQEIEGTFYFPSVGEDIEGFDDQTTPGVVTISSLSVRANGVALPADKYTIVGIFTTQGTELAMDISSSAASGDDNVVVTYRTKDVDEAPISMTFGGSAGGYMATAMGESTKAIGRDSHAEGYGSVAKGIGSHAEGGYVWYAGGDLSSPIAGGTANGHSSHASGWETIADGDVQTAIGKLNVPDDTSAFIIGNGNWSPFGEKTRSNALKVDWDGNVECAGSVTATGAVSGSSVIDSVGSLADLRDSVSQVHKVMEIGTFKSGYSGSLEGGYVGIVKSINCKITPSAAIAQGAQVTVATLSDDFKAKSFTSAFAIAANTICYCDITTNGNIIVRPTTGSVGAGTNIWLRAVYI